MIFLHNRLFINIKVEKELEPHGSDVRYLCTAYNEKSKASIIVLFNKSKTSLSDKLKVGRDYYIEGYLSTEDEVVGLRLERVVGKANSTRRTEGLHFCFKLRGAKINNNSSYVELICEPVGDSLYPNNIKMVCNRRVYEEVLKQVEGDSNRIVYTVSHLMNNPRNCEDGMNIRLPFITAKVMRV